MCLQPKRWTPGCECWRNPIPVLRDEILAQREHKQHLIASKEQALIEGVHNGTRERLQQIELSLQARSERVRNGDIGELEKTEQDMLKRMRSGKARLEGVFDEQLVKASQQFALLKTDIREQAQKYCIRPAKSSPQPRKARTWCALKFKWAPVLAF